MRYFLIGLMGICRCCVVIYMFFDVQFTFLHDLIGKTAMISIVLQNGYPNFL